MRAAQRKVELDFEAMLDSDGRMDRTSHDLLSLAREAYLLDRRDPRGASPDDSRWHRNLHLTVPVQDVGMWSSQATTGAVRELLGWITDDSWHLSWVPADPASEPLGQARLDLEADRDVILFSGGLDATAGTAALLVDRQLDALAIFTNRRMQAYQKRAIDALRAAQLGDLAFTQIRFSVHNGKRDAESTRRTRGLVFLAIGAAVARQKGRSRLVMAENGIGAINLPLTKAQSGAMTSRSAHPRTLKLFEDLIELVYQEEFTVETPFLAMTKAEMVRTLPNAARAACAASESCDVAAAGRGNLRSRCGYCSSCILRRLAFSVSGRAEWDHPKYFSDIEPNLELSQEPEMLWQVARLENALLDPDPLQLLNEFPELASVPREALGDKGMRRLFAQYVKEWRSEPRPLVRRFLGVTSCDLLPS